MNHAVSHKSRTEAFTKALQAFSHKDTELHNYEMDLGVDKALCLKLGYVVVTYTKSGSEQINLVCQCLCKVYMCDVGRRIKSFHDIGATEIIPLLLQVWNQQQQQQLLQATTTAQYYESDDAQNHREREGILSSALQVFRVYAKLDETIKSFLIHYDDGAMIAKFMQLIESYCSQQLASPMGSQSPILVLELLGLIKDLTFRSHISDKEFLLRVSGGITKRALKLCCTTGLLMSNSRVAELVSAILWNVVLTPSMCIELLQCDSRDRDILVFPRAMCRILASASTDSGGEYHYSTKARRNAVSVIGNLLLSTEVKSTLMGRHYQQQLRLVETLMNLVEHDKDSIIRRRAMRTIRCLSSVTQDVNISAEHAVRCQCTCVDVLMEHNMIPFLAHTISRNVNEDDDNDRDTQIQACESVIALALAGLVKKEADWVKLDESLIQRVETTTDPKLILAACRCISISIERKKTKRPTATTDNNSNLVVAPLSHNASIKFSDIFWKRLEYAVSVSKETHLVVSQLLLLLAKYDEATNDSAETTTPSPLSCTLVVNAMTWLLSESGCQFDESRNNAVEAVTTLVQNESNKKPLAENERLLSALVNVCLLNPSGRSDKKDSAKQLILELVPEL